MAASPRLACRGPPADRGDPASTTTGTTKLRLEACYAWLAERVGFWPLFLAVGESDEARRTSGYQNQWSRLNRPPPGDPPRPRIMFSWSNPPPGAVHLDYGHWYFVLNSVVDGPSGHPHDLRIDIGDRRVESWVLHRSWGRADWLRAARQRGSVQAVVPVLDLTSADEIWAPNQPTARALARLGFSQVVVRRLTVY